MMTDAEIIDVVSARERGETIQYRMQGGRPGWTDLTANPAWNFAAYDYRVKPKPREWWVLLNDNKCSIEWFVRQDLALHGMLQGDEMICVREVTED